MEKKIAAVVATAPVALMLTASTAFASSYAVPLEEQPASQDQYQEVGDLACVTLLGPDASPDELQAQAQTILAEDPTDPNGLDADGNGLACEFSQGATGEVMFEDGSGFVEDSASPAPLDIEVPAAPTAESNQAVAQPTADTLVPRTAEPNVPTATSAQTPRQLSPSSGPKELPATGGVDLSVLPLAGGAALVGTVLLMLLAKRRSLGV